MPRAKWSGDEGSASIEFIAAGLLLLVPLMYLVIALSSVQVAALAVEGASRHAVRVFVQAPGEVRAFARATRAVEFVSADAHLTEPVSTRVRCSPVPANCLLAGSRVTITVSTRIPLPFIPDLFGLKRFANIPISARSTEVVSRFHS
jgi:hypothetical protein